MPTKEKKPVKKAKKPVKKVKKKPIEKVSKSDKKPAKKSKKSGGKRKKSSYNLFMKKTIPKMKQKNPNISHAQAFKMAAQEWSKQK